MILPLDFDQVNFRVTRVPTPPGDSTYDVRLGGTVLNYHGVKDAYFSRVSDDVVIGSDKARYVSAYNLVTGATTQLWDTLPSGSNGRLYSFSTGAKDDTVAMATGGSGADTDTRVIWHQFSSGRSASLDIRAIRGAPVHNVRLDLGGRYVEIALVGGNAVPYIWDTTTGRVSPFSPAGGGHRVGGYGVFLNEDLFGSIPFPCLVIRWAGSLANLRYACVPGWVYGAQLVDTHLNWSDAITPSLAPVLVSSYWDDASPDPFVPGHVQTVPLNNELYAQSPQDGSVYRFGFLYATGGYSVFSYQPICAMSRDARYAACSSNHAQTWGTSKSSGLPRIDVKVWELPRN
jgi:hypothetical protein